MKRWHYYALIGLIFGILDWFYLDWLARGVGPNLGENPLIVIPIIIAMNYGIWLIPIIPVTIFEARKSADIRRTGLAGILTWCCAIFSYYVYYWILLSMGKLVHLEHLNIFGERYDGFWSEYGQMFWRIILAQFLEWLPIAVIGGGLVGVIAWRLFHKRINDNPA